VINDRFKYAMLLSSLPLHPANLFAAKQLPVSRIQLDKRLAWLDADDARHLEQIEMLVHWSKISDQPDDLLFKHARTELDAIDSAFLKEIVLWRLELRTLMSALRRRHSGETSAPTPAFRGFGKWPALIIRHWQEKDFGIGHLQPWLPKASDLIEQNKTYELEKMLLNRVWQHYSRIGCYHYFDFPAVVIYVLRWDIINRWSSYNKEQGLARFDELVSAGLADVSMTG